MCNGPSDKSLLFFHQAFCKIHTPFAPVISSRKCCWRTLILAYVFVLCFSSSISWSSEIQFDVIQLETWASTEHLIAFWILECFVFPCFQQSTHCTKFFSIVWATVYCALCQGCLVDLWMGLVFLVLWSDSEAPFPTLVLAPSPLSVWIVGVIILIHKRWEW